jgi:hypothetical protein
MAETQSNIGKCDQDGCNEDVTHDRSVRINDECLKVEYYCAAHAPEDAALIEED